MTTSNWPAPHQIGQRHDGTRQVLDPDYAWGNTGGGDYNNPTSVEERAPGLGACGPRADSVFDYIKLGRDYIVGVKPGYVSTPTPTRSAARRQRRPHR